MPDPGPLHGIQVLEHPRLEPGHLQHALFDFDGTLSLLRAGWQSVMVEYFSEVLGAAADGGPSTVESECRHFIARLTGQQTIYQAIELADRVRRRGGVPAEPAEYKAEYLTRLHRRIDPRREDVRRGRRPRQEFLVPGSVDLLEGLRGAGVTCHLASGTDVEFVREEAELLGLTRYFAEAEGEPRIYGAVAQYRSFSKRLVIERIAAEQGLAGDELVAFGDGYVELEETRRAGGVAVGVASREDGGEGFDSWKQQRLRDAGAHILVADWRPTRGLLEFLGVTA